MKDNGKHGTKNNHFVPQFILKRFGNRINVFNVRTQDYCPNRNPKSIFREIGLYPDELENKFNEKMERDASLILTEKIITAEKSITLTRKEVQLIKRFFLMGILRTRDSIKLGALIKEQYPKHQKILDPKGRYSHETTSNETYEEYWTKTLESILNQQEDYSPKTIYDDPNSTFFAFYWTVLVTSGYIAIWDAPKGYEFVITDIGMTSEIEKRNNPYNALENRKTNLLLSLKQFYKEYMNESEDKELRLKTLNQIIMWQYLFHETFYMFPLSAKRMIVLVNPFFKQYVESYNHLNIMMPPLNYFTNINDIRLFSPNQSEKTLTDYGPRSLDDKYTYYPIKLKTKDVEYCNCLLMDRIHTWLGFGSMNGIYKSILAYEKYPCPLNNYSKLFTIAHDYEDTVKQKSSSKSNNQK